MNRSATPDPSDSHSDFPELTGATRDCLGWLNFASGQETDVRFMRTTDQLFRVIRCMQPTLVVRVPRAVGAKDPGAGDPSKGSPDAVFTGHLDFSRFENDPPLWREFFRVQREELAVLRRESAAFADPVQASRALDLAEHVILPAYREYHRDLLFHQTEESLFQPFFVARVLETILRVVLTDGVAWDDREAITERTIAQLNDYIGYRPIPILNNQQKMQPWPHEFFGVVPLWVAGAGVASGPYGEVVEQLIRVLKTTPPELLEQAWFDPDQLEEIALDVRAYDFGHPGSHRPNNQFGAWDPHRISVEGFYSRYVLQQVTLEIMLRRLDGMEGSAREERAFEAGAVLAGTMLMGGAVTGNSPGTHDSSTTLATLLPKIAAFRDQFYASLIESVEGPFGERLRAEALEMRQPMGGARTHLNRSITHFRAEQHQRVRLAALLAEMGAEEAAAQQSARVPVASARMRAMIGCRLADANRAIDMAGKMRTHLPENGPSGDQFGGSAVDAVDAARQTAVRHAESERAAARELYTAERLSDEIRDLLHRAIECGAMVDPWCILGFEGHYSLSPSLEDTIIDDRVDELIGLLRNIFRLEARLLQSTAVRGDASLEKRVSHRMEELSLWWDKFASTKVSTIESFSGQDAWESAVLVARALGAWQRGGTASGDLRFWKEHALEFHTAKAHSLVVDAMLEHGDMVAASALLIHWLGQSDTIPLMDGDYLFCRQAIQWMERLWSQRHPADAQRRWEQSCKFIDFLVANAGEYGEMPEFELAVRRWRRGGGGGGMSPGDFLRGKTPDGEDAVSGDAEDSGNPESENLEPGDIDEKLRQLLEKMRLSAAVWNRDGKRRRRGGEVSDGDQNVDDGNNHDGDDDPDLFGDPGDDDLLDGLNEVKDFFDDDSDDDSDDEAESLFDAAYEKVTYRDTTDDGNDAEMMEGGGFGGLAGDLELSREVDRVSQRLGFLMTVSMLRRMAASASFSAMESGDVFSEEDARQRAATLAEWASQCREQFTAAESLMHTIAGYRIPATDNSFDSLMEYDQRHALRESLVERTIAARAEFADSARRCRAMRRGVPDAESGHAEPQIEVISQKNGLAVRMPRSLTHGTPPNREELLQIGMRQLEPLFEQLLGAALRGERREVLERWHRMRPLLGLQPTLHTPLSRGGRVEQIDRARNVQQIVQTLLSVLPRLGLMDATVELLETIQRMERFRPVGSMAISEFSRHFDMACREMVFCLHRVTRRESVPEPAKRPANRSSKSPELRMDASDDALLELLERLMICLNELWHHHTDHVRLSVLESVQDNSAWRPLVRFIESYGKDLFTQRFFMTFGNLRAILLQGVELHLRQLMESNDPVDHVQLLDDIDEKIPMHRAAECLSTVIEAILENYEEYRDYNASTTQSDHGELLYIFLDFLRLKADYDRHAWNLQPLGVFYRALLDANRLAAAEEWNRLYRKFCRPQAKRFRKRIDRMVTEYGVRLQSLEDRISEGFVRPLEVSRLCAWVCPAMEWLRAPSEPFAAPGRTDGGRNSSRRNAAAAPGSTADAGQLAWERLQKEMERMASLPIGTGMDDPSWISSLDHEIGRVRGAEHRTSMRGPSTTTEESGVGDGRDAMLECPAMPGDPTGPAGDDDLAGDAGDRAPQWLPIPDVRIPLDELLNTLDELVDRYDSEDDFDEDEEE